MTKFFWDRFKVDNHWELLMAYCGLRDLQGCENGQSDSSINILGRIRRLPGGQFVRTGAGRLIFPDNHSTPPISATRSARSTVSYTAGTCFT